MSNLAGVVPGATPQAVTQDNSSKPKSKEKTASSKVVPIVDSSELGDLNVKQQSSKILKPEISTLKINSFVSTGLPQSSVATQSQPPQSVSPQSVSQSPINTAAGKPGGTGAVESPGTQKLEDLDFEEARELVKRVKLTSYLGRETYERAQKESPVWRNLAISNPWKIAKEYRDNPLNLMMVEKWRKNKRLEIAEVLKDVKMREANSTSKESSKLKGDTKKDLPSATVSITINDTATSKRIEQILHEYEKTRLAGSPFLRNLLENDADGRSVECAACSFQIEISADSARSTQSETSTERKQSESYYIGSDAFQPTMPCLMEARSFFRVNVLTMICYTFAGFFAMQARNLKQPHAEGHRVGRNFNSISDPSDGPFYHYPELQLYIAAMLVTCFIPMHIFTAFVMDFLECSTSIKIKYCLGVVGMVCLQAFTPVPDWVYIFCFISSTLLGHINFSSLNKAYERIETPENGQPAYMRQINKDIGKKIADKQLPWVPILIIVGVGKIAEHQEWAGENTVIRELLPSIANLGLYVFEGLQLLALVNVYHDHLVKDLCVRYDKYGRLVQVGPQVWAKESRVECGVSSSESPIELETRGREKRRERIADFVRDHLHGTQSESDTKKSRKANSQTVHDLKTNTATADSNTATADSNTATADSKQFEFFPKGVGWNLAPHISTAATNVVMGAFTIQGVCVGCKQVMLLYELVELKGMNQNDKSSSTSSSSSSYYTPVIVVSLQNVFFGVLLRSEWSLYWLVTKLQLRPPSAIQQAYDRMRLPSSYGIFFVLAVVIFSRFLMFGFSYEKALKPVIPPEFWGVVGIFFTGCLLEDFLVVKIIPRPDWAPIITKTILELDEKIQKEKRAWVESEEMKEKRELAGVEVNEDGDAVGVPECDTGRLSVYSEFKPSVSLHDFAPEFSVDNFRYVQPGLRVMLVHSLFAMQYYLVFFMLPSLFMERHISTY